MPIKQGKSWNPGAISLQEYMYPMKCFSQVHILLPHGLLTWYKSTNQYQVHVAKENGMWRDRETCQGKGIRWKGRTSEQKG